MLLFRKRRMKKRPCPLSFRLVPYGAGWTDVYLDIGSDHHYFILSNVIGCHFTDLLCELYHLYPFQEEESGNMEYWEKPAGCDRYLPPEEARKTPAPYTFSTTPYRTSFCWEEEHDNYSKWVLTRQPNDETDFMVQMEITIDRDAQTHHSYQIRYRDLCYAAAKTYTEVLKSHGILGYHRSTYTDDLHLRYLLFLKAVALDRMDVWQYAENNSGNGVSSSFPKELKLLLFDM